MANLEVKGTFDGRDALRGLEQLQRELRETGQRIDKLGDESRRASTETRKLAASVKGIGEARAAIGQVVAAFAGFIALREAVNVVGNIAGAIKRTVDEAALFGDQLDKLSQRTGVGVQTLAELQFAAERSGAGIADVANGMRRLLRVMDAATRGQGAAVNLFGRLGISQETVAAARGVEDLLPAIAVGFRNLSSEAEKTQVSFDLFTESGPRLIPMIENVEALSQEFRNLFGTGAGDLAQKAAENRDALTNLNTAVEALKIQFASELLPSVTSATEALASLFARLRQEGVIEAFGQQIAQGVDLITAAVERAAEARKRIESVFRVGAGLVPGGPLAQIGGRAIGQDLRRRADELTAARERQFLESRAGPTIEALQTAQLDAQARALAAQRDEIARIFQQEAQAIEFRILPIRERPTDVPPSFFRVRQPAPGPQEIKLPQPELLTEVSSATEQTESALDAFGETMRGVSNIMLAATGRVDSAFQRIIAAIEAIIALSRGVSTLGQVLGIGGAAAGAPGRGVVVGGDIKPGGVVFSGVAAERGRGTDTTPIPVDIQRINRRPIRGEVSGGIAGDAGSILGALPGTAGAIGGVFTPIAAIISLARAGGFFGDPEHEARRQAFLESERRRSVLSAENFFPEAFRSAVRGTSFRQELFEDVTIDFPFADAFTLSRERPVTIPGQFNPENPWAFFTARDNPYIRGPVTFEQEIVTPPGQTEFPAAGGAVIVNAIDVENVRTFWTRADTMEARARAQQYGTG